MTIIMSHRPFADTYRQDFYESHGRECPDTKVRQYWSSLRAYKVLFPGEPIPRKDLSDPKWRLAQDAFDQDLLQWKKLIDEIKAANADIEHLFEAYLDVHYVNPIDRLSEIREHLSDLARTAQMVKAFADGLDLPEESRDPDHILAFIESGACAASIQGVIRAREDALIGKHKDLPDGEGDNE